MEENDIASRIKQYIEYTGLNNSQFAEACGIPKPSLSQILTGRNQKVSNILLDRLHTAFPELNILWLIFGEGEMTSSDSSLSYQGSQDGIIGDIEKQPSQESSAKSSEVNFAHDISFLPDNHPNKYIQANVEALTTNSIASKPNGNQDINTLFKIQDLQLQIENLHQQIRDLNENPRKVASITIYYDDSTFEIFKPANS